MRYSFYSTSKREYKIQRCYVKDMLSSTIVIMISFFIGLLILSCNSSHEYVPKAKLLVPYKAHNFTIGEVKLLDGLFKASQDAEAKYLLSLDMDRLLAPFRTESGIKPKAENYPGWETISLPGVALSFYLSGVSRLYAMTGEEIYMKNMNYILNEIEECQSRNNGYLLGSRNCKAIFAKLEKEGFYPEFDDWGKGHGEPYYVMEKLFSGLIDVYRISHIPKALKIATGLADWLERHMSHINDIELQKIMSVEYGGMNWVLADMYVITGDKRYLAMSKRWQDNEVIAPMTEGKDVLSNIHANTQFPKFSGLAARYPYTADPADLDGARFFWESVVNRRTYVTGGNSESEFFCHTDSLSHTLTPFTEENCNEYNMLKLTSLLYKVDPKVKYADYAERTLYNHILPAQNPEDGKVCYFLPLMPGAERIYRDLYNDFSCCVCSAMDSYTRHGEYIYAHNGSDIFVNLFIPSELKWKEKGITLRQETRFPYEDLTLLKLSCERESEFSLLVRNPYWLAEQMTLKVNGIVQTLTASNGYYIINRKWKTGDAVEIRLPMKIRVESMPDDRNVIALFYGPVLLAGGFDKEAACALASNNKAPALVPGEKLLEQWLRPTGDPLRYTTAIARPKEIRIEPFFAHKTEAYTVYWQKMTDKEWRQSIVDEERKKHYLVQLERSTIDKISVGNQKSEMKHSLTGKSTSGKGNAGILNDQVWRVVSSPEGFGYKIKVPSNSSASLFCRFMGRSSNESWNCKVKIDTVTIAELKKKRFDPCTVSPFDNIYPIPPELTKNKDSVRVFFTGNTMPRLLELRIIKND